MSTAPRSPGSRPAAPKPQARESQTPKSPAEKREPGKASGSQPCSHPRVQIVAREEDAEFVECLECREVFESSEFRDMAIEEKIQDDPGE
jgi:hypothetical protein